MFATTPFLVDNQVFNDDVPAIKKVGATGYRRSYLKVRNSSVEIASHV